MPQAPLQPIRLDVLRSLLAPGAWLPEFGRDTPRGSARQTDNQVRGTRVVNAK